MQKQLQTIVLFLLTSLSATAQSNRVRIDRLLKAYVAIHQYNGSALVMQDGKIVYEKSFGYRNAAERSPITKNSVFPIASLTKPFTALIILRLAEENKLSINNAVSKYIPDFPRGNEIRIQHLLTHTSGLYEPASNPKYLETVVTTRTYRPEEKMAFFKNEPLDFEPGSKFRYTNSGYDLLGIIIEKVTGHSYAEAVSTYIFNPLKMKKSGFNFATLKDTNKVSGYSFISPTKQTENVFWNGTLTYASGGLYSTAGDLVKFYQGLRDFKIISKEMFKQATTSSKGGYGYGWFIDSIYNDRVIDHGGNIPGATSYFLMMPEHKICIILLNNMTSTVLETIGNSIYALLQNKPYHVPQPKKEIHLEEAKLQQYVGTYDVNSNYKVQITEEAGRLLMTVNNQNAVKLCAESERKFFMIDDDRVLEFITTNGKVIQLKLKDGLATKVGDKVR